VDVESKFLVVRVSFPIRTQNFRYISGTREKCEINFLIHQEIREKSKLYRHSIETLENLSKLNKENKSIYKVTNINTKESFTKSFFELEEFFKSSAFYRYINKIYKKEWFIEKLKAQSKKVSLLINDRWIEFSSFEKCDKFLNKWRGYTSTQHLKKVDKIDNYNVKFI